MNYEHWVVHQMKEEKRIFPFMNVHLIKQIYDYDSKKLQWNSVSFILGRTVYLHYLSIHLSIYLYIYLSIYLSVENVLLITKLCWRHSKGQIFKIKTMWTKKLLTMPALHVVLHTCKCSLWWMVRPCFIPLINIVMWVANVLWIRQHFLPASGTEHKLLSCQWYFCLSFAYNPSGI